ncbi:MAG: GAF domain-containing protein [Fimbriimonadaceae bacterium]|nr:GAF domain-containing protein [Fimbriimonadaceae bacterium]
MNYAGILKKLTDSDRRGAGLRLDAMNWLNTLDGYDWSGIYVLRDDMLHLDMYVGEPTDHREIPVGRGVCGTAVAENSNQVVADVRELSNYLACSVSTRSEIVVLIRDGDTILGQIDIDSHTPNRFAPEDEQFLIELATLFANRWLE